MSFALRGAICWFVSSFQVHTFCVNANLKVMWKTQSRHECPKISLMQTDDSSGVNLLFLATINAIKSFPGGSVDKESACNAGDAGDVGSVRGYERSPGGGNGNPLQYSRLGNPMDRGAWQATVHSVTKNRKRLKWLSIHTHIVIKLAFY